MACIGLRARFLLLVTAQLHRKIVDIVDGYIFLIPSALHILAEVHIVLLVFSGGTLLHSERWKEV